MLARLIALLATGEASLLKRRLKTAVVSYVVVAAALVVALVFLIMAGYLAAASQWGPVQAAIWFAVGFLLLAMIVYIIYRIIDRVQHRMQQRKRVADTSMLAGASAMAMLPALVSKKGGIAAMFLAVAGLAGYAAYREFGNRGDDPPKPGE